MSPKWMLPDHDGRPMLAKAIEGLGVSAADLIVTILKEHDEKFDAARGLRTALGTGITCVILDAPTRSQSDTVAQTIRRAEIAEPFLVKDSDNFFRLSELEQPFNYVSVASLNDFAKINPQNKSYVQADQEDIIVNFREKRVISDLFSVGGYYFRSPWDFLNAFDELQSGAAAAQGELYLSEIISFMALGGEVFKARRVSDYQDWGTIHEWRERLARNSVVFVNVDGFLFEQGSRYFAPAFENAKPHLHAIETVRKSVANGHSIKYLSLRPKALEALTRRQLREQGLPDGDVVFDCAVAQWVLLTAPHTNLPFRTGHAIEISPDDPSMAEKVV
jgi:hypothetical protein